MELLRSDIVSNIKKQRLNKTFVYNNSDRGWYPLRGWTLNLSVILASLTQRILQETGYANNIHGMPLREFYPILQQIVDNNEGAVRDRMIDKELKTIQGLKLIYESESKSSASSSLNTTDTNTTNGSSANKDRNESTNYNWPRVTFNAEVAFIHTEGYKKKQPIQDCTRIPTTCNLSDLFNNQDTVMLRIGDSFMTGVGLVGHGLFNHATMIGTLSDAILYHWEQLLVGSSAGPIASSSSSSLLSTSSPTITPTAGVGTCTSPMLFAANSFEPAQITTARTPVVEDLIILERNTTTACHPTNYTNIVEPIL